MKNDFVKEIEEALQEYSSIASDTLKKVIINAGKNAVKELKKNIAKGKLQWRRGLCQIMEIQKNFRCPYIHKKRGVCRKWRVSSYSSA